MRGGEVRAAARGAAVQRPVFGGWGEMGRDGETSEWCAPAQTAAILGSPPRRAGQGKASADETAATRVGRGRNASCGRHRPSWPHAADPQP